MIMTIHVQNKSLLFFNFFRMLIYVKHSAFVVGIKNIRMYDVLQKEKENIFGSIMYSIPTAWFLPNDVFPLLFLNRRWFEGKFVRKYVFVLGNSLEIYHVNRVPGNSQYFSKLRSNYY